MQYTRLGNTGLIISRLAFGAMTFGTAPGPLSFIWKTPEQEADALVGRSIDAGINFFDTADMYADGESERILGQALKPRRQDVVISTKIGFRSGNALIRAGASYGYILNAAEASLRRLGTDYLDLLSIHKPDPFTPEEETARALDNLVERGLVRYVGYSNLPAWQAAKFVGIQKRRGYARFVAAQMYYSLVGRDLEHEIVPFCQDAGIGIVVWSPLASGFLSGRYSRENPTAGGQGRYAASTDFLPINHQRGFDAIDCMRAIAGRHQATVAQVAIAWILAKRFVATVLLGASKMAQLEDNLGAAALELLPAEIAELDRITAPEPIYPNWFRHRTLDQVTANALAPQSPAKQPKSSAAD